MTGAPLPAGSDAVLAAESVETTGGIFAISEVPPQKHVGHRGEDIVRGTTLLEAGRVLRPQDLGVMSSIGLATVPVVRRPQVRLVITGNELLATGSTPRDYHITDANGPMLAALAERDGAIVDFPGLVRDEPDAVLEALGVFNAQSPEPEDHSPDIIIVSGGSSVGIEDLAPMLVATHGELAVHGIAMRPSSPTGIGTLGSRLVFLLPGNPVSALCAYDFFAGRAIRAFGGRSKQWPYRAVRGTMTRKISSPIGRLDYARVRFNPSTRLGADPSTRLGADPSTSLGAVGSVEPLSVAGASLLSSTTRADGFVIVEQDSEGYAAGSEVEVWLYA